MKNRFFTYLSLLFLFASLSSSQAKETITFPSKDGLLITADTYMVYPDRTVPLLVLFHQAGWSRAEYVEIAPKLNEMGFNCMAVDLRSGGEVNGVVNQTAKRAEKAGKGTTYLDALPDMEAALGYARKHYADGHVIAWGSSYSAALVLKVAGEHPDLLDGVLAFSPGEYFGRFGKPEDWVKLAAGKIEDPVFITSSRTEPDRWSAIFEAIPGKDKVAYVPTTAGNHGSRALWKKFDDSSGYWQAVESFLNSRYKE